MNKLSTGSIHRVLNTPKTTLRLDRYLTSWIRSILAGEPLMRIARRRSLVLLGVLCVVGTTPAEAVTDTDYLKLYAHSRIINYKQFQCFNQLITKESNWRPNAKNGSHHGIPQGRSEYLARVNGYKQVEWGLKYIGHRYGEPCIALQHWKDKGWH